MPLHDRAYVHGYSNREASRLRDQASTLESLLHQDVFYAAGSAVLEVGCGVGAQTVPLGRGSPGARIVSIDVSHRSVAEAEKRARAAGLTNVTFMQADIFDLPFAQASFDHMFVCFLLEHLPNPLEALRVLGPLIRPGGTITVIEGDHGSTLFHPDSAEARAVVRAQVALQRLSGGDPNIGRMLYPLLSDSGYAAITVRPQTVYVDASTPNLAEGFTRRTFAAMVEGVRKPAVAAGLITAQTFDEGLRALHRAGEPDGVFCYTFFKGVAAWPGN